MAEWLCSGLQIRVPRFDSELRLHPPHLLIPMDDLVRAAMTRWPGVPDIYGWLSISRQGQWRLHPEGNALLPDACGTYPDGESISNPQILAFINRNYTHDDTGRWFFQNGPQRVFVRIDAAPLVLCTCEEGHSLETHTGQKVTSISEWWLDDLGHLYAKTDLGPGLIAGRDLMQVIDKLTDTNGKSIDFGTDAPDIANEVKWVIDPFQGAGCPAIPLKTCRAENIENVLGFVRNPALGYA